MPPKVIARSSGADPAALRKRSARIVQALSDLGTTHVVGVPDNLTRYLYEMFDADHHVQVVPVCREGEAWAIASGLWVGGRQPVVVIQNTGFFESGDSLRGTAIEMGVPLIALMDYRGYGSLGKPDADSAASFFEPILNAWGFRYLFLEDSKEAQILKTALDKAFELNQPVAVLMR